MNVPFLIVIPSQCRLKLHKNPQNIHKQKNAIPNLYTITPNDANFYNTKPISIIPSHPLNSHPLPAIPHP